MFFTLYSIFKLSPAQKADYLKVIELLESHESKSVAHLFRQKFCGYRWLENGKALKRAIELHSCCKRYFSYLKESKKIPPKDDRFTIILDKMGFPLHRATLGFSLYMFDEIEPFSTFSSRTAIGSIFVWKVKRITNLDCGKIHLSCSFRSI